MVTGDRHHLQGTVFGEKREGLARHDLAKLDRGGRESAEIRPQVVVEDVSAKGLEHRAKAPDRDGLRSTPEGVVEKQRQIAQVVPMAVGQEDVLHFLLIGKVERGGEASRIDRDRASDEERGRPLPRNRATAGSDHSKRRTPADTLASEVRRTHRSTWCGPSALERLVGSLSASRTLRRR